MSTIAPTKHRVEVLDVIRGFAIFGIIIANIQSWSGYKFIPFEVLETLNFYDYNSLIKYFFNFFVDTKFYTLFSLLFGIGFYLQFAKQKENQAVFIPTYRRRLGFLILFGAIHSFFWSGDILMIYALVGFVFILFRNFKEKTMLLLSIIFYYVWLLYDLFFALYLPDFMSVASQAYKTYPDISPQALTAIFQNGTFYEVLQVNWHNLYYRYIDLIPTGRLTKLLALFLLGYYLMSINYFKTYAKSRKLFLFLLIFGLYLEYLALQIGGSMSTFSSNLNNVLYKFTASTAQLFLALSYISILVIMYEKNWGQKLLKPFTYVGKMSFTNYLLQTFFGFLLFYPYFGGYFGSMGLLEITLLALGFYILQVVFSMLWLRFFAFGPLEWVWRCLTYKKLFPIKKIVK